MEQWEKDYLEIIRENKERIRNSDKPVQQKHKEYIEACWQEVERSDGTKYYIPDQKKLKAQIRRRQLREKVRKIRLAIFKGIKVILKGFVLIAFISGLVSSNSTFDNKDASWLRLLSHGRYAVRISELNGVKFAEMVTTLQEINRSQNGNMTAYLASGCSFSQEDLAEWMNSIDEDADTLYNLRDRYKAYGELIKYYSEYLAAIKSFVVYAESGGTNLKEELDKYDSAVAKLKPALIQVFEKNHIDYVDTDEGLTFWYGEY